MTFQTPILSNTGDKKRVLILGAAGFLGSNLVRRVLQESNIEITAVDSLLTSLSTKDNLKEVLDKITFIQGDIRNDDLLREIIPNQDIVFNCAAQTSHPYSLENPILDAEINCIGNLKLLTAIRDYAPEAIVVYPSSSSVVGKAVGDVIDESHGEKPLDIYSANKGVAEKYYQIFHNVYGLKTIVLRFANLFGPYGKNDPAFGFVNYFIGQINEGKPIVIYGDGLQTRNVMFVDDATDILWLSVFHPELIGGTYFATHHDHCSVKDIADSIIRVFGKGEVKFIPWPDVRKKIEIEKVLISSARLHYLTGWKPKYSVSEGLKLTKERVDNKHTILITGGLGHIGSRLIRELDENVVGKIIIIDDLESRRFPSLYDLPDKYVYSYINDDIRTVDLKKYLNGIHCVIHLAALTDAEGSFKRPKEVEEVNFNGLKHIADICLETGTRLFFPSTTSVYGSQDSIVDETCSELKPQSPYAEAKLRSEQYLQQLGSNGLKYVICRFGTIFGNSIGMRFDTAVNKFTWQAVNGLPLSVWRTAREQKRPYLYLGDCVRAIDFIIKNDYFNNQIYNVLTENFTVKDIVEKIIGFIPTAKVEYVDSPIMNQLSYNVDDTKFRNLGFKPEGNLHDGMSETVSQFNAIIKK